MIDQQNPHKPWHELVDYKVLRDPEQIHRYLYPDCNQCRQEALGEGCDPTGTNIWFAPEECPDVMDPRE